MNQPIPAEWYLTLGLFMFLIGGVGVAIRRNPVVVFMCVELMLNAVNLTVLTFAHFNYSQTENVTSSAMNGQVLVIFVMAVAAAEVAVGLGIIMAIFRLRQDVDIDDMSALRG